MSSAIPLLLAFTILAAPAPAAVAQSAPAAGRPASAGATAGTTVGAPVRVTLAQFRDLRWLEGTWRGLMPDGRYFYERYTRANDSTIVITHFPDSTLATRGEEEAITLRGGTVRHGRANAIRLDAAGIAFAAPANTRPDFTFTPAANGWTATIHRRDAAGVDRPVVYQMQRYAAPGSQGRSQAAAQGAAQSAPRAASQSAPQGAAQRPAQSAAQQTSDREAVRRAVLDYVEGFYEGDTTKLVRSMWPEVRKYGYGRDQASGAYRGMTMQYPSGFMGYANGVRAGRTKTPANAPRDITIFDVQDQTASAKLTAWWGTDYLLLGKENGRWMITHVLWQSPPPRSP